MNSSLRLISRRVCGSVSQTCKRVMSSDADLGGPTTERPRTEKCLNKVTLLGRVGREGDVRGTAEHPCLIFPMATSFTFKKASTGEFQTKTDWHRICVFQNGLRQVASTINKGDRILVEGSLSHQRFMDENNRSVNITSVIADDIVFLSRRRNRQEDEEATEENL